MGESLRCPFCGWIGGRRTETVCEYLPAGSGPPTPPGRGPLARQVDRYECEVCRQEWEEETYRRVDPSRRAAGAAAKSG